MKLLGEIRRIEELNTINLDGVLLYLQDFSSPSEKSFTKDEIINLPKGSNKKLYLVINLLYKDSELDELDSLLSELSFLDGFFFQDLGLVEIFKKYNILDKAIYNSGTFISNYKDSSFYLGDFNKFQISRELTIDEINKINESKSCEEYFYNAFGYEMMFYSLRKHFSNYEAYNNEVLNLKNRFDLTIKEETRKDYYPTVENEKGFFIYREELFNGYNEIKGIGLDNIILSRTFISDEMYYDTISLFRNELEVNEYNNKYQTGHGYLYRPVGLLKE